MEKGKLILNLYLIELKRVAINPSILMCYKLFDHNQIKVKRYL